MGNRAVLTLKNDTQDRGVYLHWNGGAGSVAALLRETKKRMGGDMVLTPKTDTSRGYYDESGKENEITKFYAIFYGVARELFGYCTRSKTATPISVYMQRNVKGSDSDNGTYIIEDDFSCSRINVDSLDKYERKNYDMFEDFFAEVHHALSVVVEEEDIPYESKDDTSAMIEKELEYALEIEKNAAQRVLQIKQRLADKKELEECEAEKTLMKG